MGYINAIIILCGINIIAALGVAILTGYTGLFSIGHAGFMALGGYMSAILVKEFGMPLAIALLQALRSGWTPIGSQLEPKARRNPHLTSSRMSAAPVLSQIARRCLAKVTSTSS